MVVSLLKAWYGDAANAGNDFAYHYMPKRDEKKNYSHMQRLKQCIEVKSTVSLSTVPIRSRRPQLKQRAGSPDQVKWMVSMISG
jgi:formate dehydrogenase major subunit